jgi:hypothetical protein
VSTTVTKNGRAAERQTAPTAPSPVTDDEMLAIVQRNLQAGAWLNLVARALLGLTGLAAGVLALRYVEVHGQEMVTILSQPRATGNLVGDQLLALSAPVLLFVVLAGMAAAAAWTVHGRGQEELGRTLDAVTRLKREGEVAVSARGLVFAFEEKLQNARSAFTLLLWLGRTLFIVCLGLFGLAVINAIVGGVDLLTVGLSATSLAGALISVAVGVPRSIKESLSDVVQIQSIITGCDRQISLLESDALAALNDHHTPMAETHKLVIEATDHISAVVASSVDLIERAAVRHRPS